MEKLNVTILHITCCIFLLPEIMSILIAGRAIWSSKLCNAFLSEAEDSDDSDENSTEFQVLNI
jgi:hypothetical protein